MTARTLDPDYQKLAMQSAIGEYRAFLWSLTDNKLTPVVRSGIRIYAKKLLERHAASEDAFVSPRPAIRVHVRPEETVVADLQCTTCLRCTSYADVAARPFTNPGRCYWCGGSLVARVKASA